MRHSAISRYPWLSGRMSAEFNVARWRRHEKENRFHRVAAQPASSLAAGPKASCVAILVYQLAIFSFVLLGAFFGEKALFRTTFWACTFTFVNLYMPWLIGVQFITIGVAHLVGRPIAKAHSARLAKGTSTRASRPAIKPGGG